MFPATKQGHRSVTKDSNPFLETTNEKDDKKSRDNEDVFKKFLSWSLENVNSTANEKYNQFVIRTTSECRL